MVGEGVLHECLLHPDVEQVLVVGRKPCGVTHPKLKEIVNSDFFNLTAIEDQLQGYNACYFCLGVSSIGMKEPEYSHLTCDLTLNFANTLIRYNPGNMTFCYVSGVGTDSTEHGKQMWARVKGKTENQLLRMPFKKAYMFRPSYMHPTPGLKNTLKYYKYLSWMYPFFRAFLPKYVSTLKELGLAMINVTQKDYPTQILGVKDIVAAAR